jgi:hypothetical protein
MKLIHFLSFLLLSQLSFAQLSDAYFDAVDSLMETTPAIELCKINGKEDLRFFSKTPEKYSNYKQQFIAQAVDAFKFAAGSHFFCDITVEVNCSGKAGNYDLAIEPRTFNISDFENFKQLIALLEKLRSFSFQPAIYLGEAVNSKVKFRVLAKDGKVVLQ